MSRYNNPPLVEAWIAFDYEAKPDKTKWDIDQVSEFAKAYSEFATMDALYREEFKVQKKDDKSLPTITHRSNTLDVVRMVNEDNTRIRQLANDRIAFNLLRKAGDEYPGFDVLLEDAFVFHGQYQAFFQPAATKLATIHYVDIVDILGDDEPLVLTEFFNFIPDIPVEPFGYTIGYSLAFVTKCPLDDAPVQSKLAWIPSPEPLTMRLRLDWEKPCLGINFGNTEEAKARLKQNHEFMVDCFENVLTDKTRQLFD